MVEVEKIVRDGEITYFTNNTDILHREDGPAIEDGHKEWWVYGKRHRVDGPAAIYKSIKPTWWLNNIQYSKEKWFEALNEERKEKMLYSEYFIRS
jgi:hypothetical protein